MENREHLSPGAEIAGYRVASQLHAGGMAELYRMTPPGGGESCVLKVPKLGFGNHPACYTGFEAEQMILGRLGGPHVPRLHATGEDAFGPYLIMELVAGKSLADYAQRAPLAADEVSRLGAAFAYALHDIHRQEVVHHDLKPSHVILRENGAGGAEAEAEAVLIDFGLASHGHLPDFVASEANRPLGTPAYLSPEQILGQRGDPRSDLFMLGVTLYLLATGRLPFGSPTSVSGLRRRLYLDPTPPRSIRADLPPWLQEIILHCLEVRLENRYATAAQVAHDLIHPDQVALSERSRRSQGRGLRSAIARWWSSLRVPLPQRKPPTLHLAQALHILVAIDTENPEETLHQALRDTVRGLVAGQQHWRLTCVSVLESSLITEQEDGEEIGRSLHTQRLLGLHHWVQPLALPREHLRFLVLEGGDVAGSLIEYARARHADHVVIGARGSSRLRRFLGSVSARVTAEAPCSVTVVRANASAQSETSD